MSTVPLKTAAEMDTEHDDAEARIKAEEELEYAMLVRQYGVKEANRVWESRSLG